MLSADFGLDLVARFGSPVYAYDLQEVERRVDELQTSLPDGATLLYSLKANPLPGIAHVMAASGLEAEVSSPGELGVALGAGFAPSRILYTGPGKTASEVEEAIAHGVGFFSTESLRDHQRIVRCAAERREPVSVLFRLNPGARGDFRLSMSGEATQFGFDDDAFAAFLHRRDIGERWARPAGVHVFTGTQVASAAALARNFEDILRCARAVFDTGRVAPRVINFGGGFAWPFGNDDGRPDVHELGAALAATFDGARIAEQYWFESGRFLTAACGTLLSTVLDVKESRGRRFVVLDAGINHIGGMAGLGRIHLAHLVIAPLADTADADAMPATVVGPLCTPLDVLARHYEASVTPGQVVAIPNVGAYAATASLTGFLSRPPAVEVTYRGKHVVEAYRLRVGHESLSRPWIGDSGSSARTHVPVPT
jgi:diaminopimelate decarboxylase